jgi:hypothetical protein
LSRTTHELTRAHAPRALACAALVALGCAAPAASIADPFASLEGRVAYDNNLTDAKEPGDIEDDTSLSFAGAYGSRLDLGQWGSIEAAAQGRLTQYARYTGLDAIDVGARVAWRDKLGLGLYAPAVSVALDANHASFDNDLRDGWLGSVTLDLSKRWSSAWSTFLDIGLEYRSQDNTPATVLLGLNSQVFRQFDQFQRVGTRYGITERLSLLATLARRAGDADLTIHGGPDADFGDALSVAADPAFGANEFAERVKAVTRSTVLGLNYALDAHSSLSAVARYDLTREPSGDTYRRMVNSVVYSYAF